MNSIQCVIIFVKKKCMSIGIKLMKLRKNMQLSQEFLAFELNVSKTTLRKWEADESKPLIENLQKLSDYFNVQITYWFDSNDENKINDALLLQIKQFLK